MKLIEIAGLLKGKIEGNGDLEINHIGKIETAVKNEITFISNPKYEKFFDSTSASAVIISEDLVLKSKREDISIIRVSDPYNSFLILLDIFEKEKENNLYGISENVQKGKNTVIGEKVYLANFVNIGDDCSIGKGTKIYSNTSIDNNCEIGSECKIYPNVTIYRNCIIGNNVIIHSGTVIGSDGFGFAKQEDGTYKKIPQTGRVIIEDNVEIGSNCSIDRATLGETKLCKGVKLDNQIQIAHNVIIGEDTVIAAQVGIAGSTKIGKRCMIGGQSGIVGHIEICDDVMIGAAVGVSKSIDKPGLYTGYRIKPHREDLKTEVNIRNIPKLEIRIKELENKISK